MFRGSHVVVVAILILFCFLWVIYAIAVTSHHVDPVWPYISYTGNRPVESCIFSFALSFSSALFLLIVYLRYVQLCNVIENSSEDDAYLGKMRKLNLFSVILGSLGALGLSIASSFQQMIFYFCHVLGVFLCTYSSLLYFILQTYLTYKLASHLTNRFVKIIRVIAVTTSFAILVTIPAVLLADYSQQPKGIKLVNHVQSEGDVVTYTAMLEWALLFFYFIFIASFYADLKKVSLTKDKIIFLE